MKPYPIEVERLAKALALNAGWSKERWWNESASIEAGEFYRRAIEIHNATPSVWHAA